MGRHLAAYSIWCWCCLEAGPVSGRSRPIAVASATTKGDDARLEMRGDHCAVVRAIDDARRELTAWGLQTREAFA